MVSRDNVAFADASSLQAQSLSLDPVLQWIWKMMDMRVQEQVCRVFQRCTESAREFAVL